MEKVDKQKKYRKWLSDDPFPTTQPGRRAAYAVTLPSLHEHRRSTCQFHFGELDQNGKEIYLPIIDRMKVLRRKTYDRKIFQTYDEILIFQRTGDPKTLFNTNQVKQQGTFVSPKTFFFSNNMTSLKTEVMKTDNSVVKVPELPFINLPIFQTQKYEKSYSLSSNQKLKASLFERFCGLKQNKKHEAIVVVS